MKKVKKYPKVIIVGRTNVGKSTIFNRLARQNKSIVLDEEGITRDYIEENIEWNGKNFTLVDTGGISLRKQQDPILEKVREKVLAVLKKSALVIFVCDGKNGLIAEDKELAKTLHKTKKPLLLAINKSDNQNALEENIHEFYSLGIKKMITLSALHGKGILDLLDETATYIPDTDAVYTQEEPAYKVALIGKPNVGKSSLMNLLTKTERSLVTEQAGTTREAISENVYFMQDMIQITDTAGVRKKSRIKTDDVETLMVKSSLSSVRQADIIVLLVDASEQKLSDQELKLLFYAYENKKAIIIVFNKTDLIDAEERKYLEHTIKEYEFILTKIPTVWTSCLTKKNVEKVYKQIAKIRERLAQTFDSTTVEELVKAVLIQKPMLHKRQPLLVKKIRHVEYKIPTFNIKVNHPQWFGPTQLGFIENIIRKHYDLKGCPIKLNVKKG